MATTPKIPERPVEEPMTDPKGPPSPYPADEPPFKEAPGTEPDVIPGTTDEPPAKM